ncbi:cell wall hydrolase [Oleomonas cavernae]|uniref:Cell wall hydrolase n=2 Tax=Oleomonas cavernae TaxID=2320859 RepID=A0A418WIQ2_9PROT|nr:cell wall hydrolase [Oleomonas cavernae]
MLAAGTLAACALPVQQASHAAAPVPGIAAPPPVHDPLPPAPQARNVTVTDRDCLIVTLYYEAGGEGAKGLAAVGHVVLNRLDNRPPDTTICDVIYEKGQFGWTRKVPRKSIPGVIGTTQRWQNAAVIADAVLSGTIGDPTDGAHSFYSILQYGKRTPKWARKLTRTAQIGNHVFLR